MAWRILVVILIFALPTWLARKLFVFSSTVKIGRGSKVGFSIVYADFISLGENVKIGHLNIIYNLTRLVIDDGGIIGNRNWIKGFPKNHNVFFIGIEREPSFEMGKEAAVTNLHRIDCTTSVVISEFATLAGYGSQLISHSINIAANRQTAKPITVGKYCFVGTSCIMLPGSNLPNFCVLSAGSVLHKSHTGDYGLYSGVPAVRVKELEASCGYFLRTVGVVH